MMYPEIQTANYKFAITDNGNGTITIDASQAFKVGNVILNTDDFTAPNRTLAHSANKTYHLRYSLNGEDINVKQEDSTVVSKEETTAVEKEIKAQNEHVSNITKETPKATTKIKTTTSTTKTTTPNKKLSTEELMAKLRE